MNKLSKTAIIVVAALTIASVVTWQITGGDWYTKYEIVELVESKPNQEDPLVAAGFYDGSIIIETVRRDEFRLGLLPTPAGIFDKHVLSVTSVAGPLWALLLSVVWYQRRRAKLQQREVR